MSDDDPVPPPPTTTTAPPTTTTAPPPPTTTSAPGTTTTSAPGTTTTSAPGTTTTSAPGTTTTSAPGTPAFKSVTVDLDPDDGADHHAHSLQVATDVTLTLKWETSDATSVHIEGLGDFDASGSQDLTAKDASYILVAKGDGDATSEPYPLEVHTHDPGQVVSPHVDLGSGVAAIVSFQATMDGQPVSEGKAGDEIVLVVIVSDGTESVKIAGQDAELTDTHEGHQKATLKITLEQDKGNFECEALLKDGTAADKKSVQIEIALSTPAGVTLEPSLSIKRFLAKSGGEALLKKSDGIPPEATDDLQLPPGDSAILQWEVEGEVASLSIDNGVGDVTGLSSVEVQYQPGSSKELQYTLIATPKDTSQAAAQAKLRLRSGALQLMPGGTPANPNQNLLGAPGTNAALAQVTFNVTTSWGDPIPQAQCVVVGQAGPKPASKDGTTTFSIEPGSYEGHALRASLRGFGPPQNNLPLQDGGEAIVGTWGGAGLKTVELQAGNNNAPINLVLDPVNRKAVFDVRNPSGDALEGMVFRMTKAQPPNGRWLDNRTWEDKGKTDKNGQVNVLFPVNVPFQIEFDGTDRGYGRVPNTNLGEAFEKKPLRWVDDSAIGNASPPPGMASAKGEFKLDPFRMMVLHDDDLESTWRELNGELDDLMVAARACKDAVNEVAALIGPRRLKNFKTGNDDLVDGGAQGDVAVLEAMSGLIVEIVKKENTHASGTEESRAKLKALLKRVDDCKQKATDSFIRDPVALSPPIVDRANKAATTLRSKFEALAFVAHVKTLVEKAPKAPDTLKDRAGYVLTQVLAALSGSSQAEQVALDHVLPAIKKASELAQGDFSRLKLDASPALADAIKAIQPGSDKLASTTSALVAFAGFGSAVPALVGNTKGPSSVGLAGAQLYSMYHLRKALLVVRAVGYLGVSLKEMTELNAHYSRALKGWGAMSDDDWMKIVRAGANEKRPDWKTIYELGWAKRTFSSVNWGRALTVASFIGLAAAIAGDVQNWDSKNPGLSALKLFVDVVSGSATTATGAQAALSQSTGRAAKAFLELMATKTAIRGVEMTFADVIGVVGGLFLIGSGAIQVYQSWQKNDIEGEILGAFTIAAGVLSVTGFLLTAGVIFAGTGWGAPVGCALMIVSGVILVGEIAYQVGVLVYEVGKRELHEQLSSGSQIVFEDCAAFLAREQRSAPDGRGGMKLFPASSFKKAELTGYSITPLLEALTNDKSQLGAFFPAAIESVPILYQLGFRVSELKRITNIDDGDRITKYLRDRGINVRP